MLVLDYQQLVASSSSRDQQSHRTLQSGEGAGCNGGREPDWSAADACVEAMGPHGDGFVVVRGMKDYASMRSRLLRLAHKLALMPNIERAAILKEHGLGTDVPLKDPGRPVSSFAAQFRFECPPEVGLLIARLCDAARSHGSMHEVSLEQAILESGTAKGRLIHYHSFLEQEVLSSFQDLLKGHKLNINASGGRKAEISNLATDSGGSVSTWWQQWHCDYGIFTVLTSPLFLKPIQIVSLEADGIIDRDCSLTDAPIRSSFHLEANLKLSEQNSSRLLTRQSDSLNIKAEMEEKPQRTRLPQLSSSTSCHLDLKSCVQECSSPDGHSSLIVMDTYGRTTSLVIPSEYLIVQVGEAAQLLSGGDLVARAHCVVRPTSAKDVSRETMAVFLQPSWKRRMSLPLGVPQERALAAGGIAKNLETQIPRLATRWKDGCTFAEFSKETTRQYYGADGYQSRR